ncbi:sugar phosphate isomerase/epimerase family protein [Sphingomonas sp. BIUV-7]|uniref:Sugar phosphate isomerase/epimerase family protein n=1 Tax=Sphingomonas natans TaxID=3063330 RepID=A0ABT8Y876_9SPHN|nr:sugar phosphate isomerase/epimerase family protein [Sphingomonas sp. BIUV-7]MDO6414519.1 sugar phosphate isomerase/epimerase family protein [Sphingomonas sp. BIUV-7]
MSRYEAVARFEVRRMHSRISVNTLSLDHGSLAEHIDRVARLGCAAISPTCEDVDGLGIEPAGRRLRDAGLQVATLTHRAFGFAMPALAGAARARLARSIEIAGKIEASSVTLTTGGRGELTWAQANDRFAEAIAPCVEQAARAGVALTLEPTSHLYADASFAHRLSDLVTVCERAGTAICLDTFACWFDADIDVAIKATASRTRIVQLSDYMGGDRGLPCRAVPGDGIAGLHHLVWRIEEAGFRGFYDLELIGPRIVAEGAQTALRRAAEWLAAVLESAGS